MSQKSFTTRKTLIDFDIEGEVFYVRPVAAGQVLTAAGISGRLAEEAGKPKGNPAELLLNELAAVLEPESFARFAPRFWGKNADGTHVEGVVIDSATLQEILEWIYGEALGKGRTPQPSS